MRSKILKDILKCVFIGIVSYPVLYICEYGEIADMPLRARLLIVLIADIIWVSIGCLLAVIGSVAEKKEIKYILKQYENMFSGWSLQVSKDRNEQNCTYVKDNVCIIFNKAKKKTGVNLRVYCPDKKDLIQIQDGVCLSHDRNINIEALQNFTSDSTLKNEKDNTQIQIYIQLLKINNIL